MKISYEWIRKYVPIKMRAKNLAEKLTMCGMEITSMERRNKDFIFDIEITSNRPDVLSHIGIAREVAAITKRALTLPSFNLKRYFIEGIKTPEVIVKDAKACPRYTARLITNVKVKPSPKWLIERIESMGLRPINNVVDITSFALFETGYPLHAFDYDKIAGNKIIIRPAKENEEITTIDKEKRKLKSTTLVIADIDKPIAIAGIMGGENTEVSSSTKQVLLEAACFDPISIRRSSRSLALSTDSSYRFERGIDISGVEDASDRAATLICEIAKGKTHKRIVDIGKITKTQTIISLRPQRVNLLLGNKLSFSDMKSSLTRLGFKVKDSKSVIKVTAPSFRNTDIKKEIDLIEEIARIYGYDNIPTILPKVITTEESPSFKIKQQVVDIIRETLSSLGFNEALSYSLISKADVRKLNIPDVNTIPIQNPLSDQQEIMRNTLLAGMLKAINYNINMGNPNVKLFEISNIYFKENEDLKEGMNLSLGMCGETISDWQKKPKKIDIFYLKGALKTLFSKLGIGACFEESQHPSFSQGATLAILNDNKLLGIAGIVETAVLNNMDIKTEIYASEINVEEVIRNARLDKYFKTIIKYPSSERDISICINKDIRFENINNAIKHIGGSIIKNIALVEEYKGDQIPEGKRNLLIRITYQSSEKTLAEQEIETIDSLIRKRLIQDFDATLR